MDVAASIAGLISLSVTLFRGCVQGFELVSAARHIGDDADRIHSMLDWEQCRLLQWGERVGLDGLEGHNRTLNWGLITDFLRQLQSLLSDAQVLRDRYGLIFVETDTSTTFSRASTAVESIAQKKGGIGKLWSYVKPDIRNTRARIISEKAGPVKRLRWAALDQNKIRRLIGDIGYFNNCMHDLLESAEQDFVRSTLSALLRDLVSRTTVSSDLEVIRALIDDSYISQSSSIEAAACLKEIRMLVGFDKRNDENVPLTPKLVDTSRAISNTSSTTPIKQALSKLSYQSLIRDTSRAENPGRELALYRSSRKNIHSQVLVEWKTVEKAVENKLKRRIQDLAYLMMNITDLSFHSLRCLGFLCHETGTTLTSYAYVYEVANLNQDQGPQAKPVIRPLLALFDNPRTPSLTFRIRLAKDLAETLLQLHTSGWLHKGIRSDNVLFIDRGDLNWENGTSLGPYVTGYEYARADNPLEMTEDAPSNPSVDLYRHPQAQGIVRPSFKKIFDLYALGCVLLEIALWTSLQVVLLHIEHVHNPNGKSAVNASSANEQAHLDQVSIIRGKERLLDEEASRSIFDRVAFHAGDNYRKVVEMCFFPSETGNEEELECSVSTQMEIVKLLEQQKC